MDILTVFMLAIGLSFDTFAVSVTSGVILPKITFLKAVRFALVLAFFQALMPFIGWLAGSAISSYVTKFDHWIALSLLTILGVKMIIESRNDNTEEEGNPLDLKVNITMAIATSIDALVVGVSYAFLSGNSKMITILLIIGAVTFFVSMLGILFGKKVGMHLGRRMEILGGFILIAIGIKILIEHLA